MNKIKLKKNVIKNFNKYGMKLIEKGLKLNDEDIVIFFDEFGNILLEYQMYSEDDKILYKFIDYEFIEEDGIVPVLKSNDINYIDKYIRNKIEEIFTD